VNQEVDVVSEGWFESLGFDRRLIILFEKVNRNWKIIYLG
jgi:hypothetical protein